MADLVQLSHPGKQINLAGQNPMHYVGFNRLYGLRLWNTEDTHYRKFLKIRGKYICKDITNPPKEDEIYFWGEWEPFSIYKRLNSVKNNPNFPNSIHFPIMSKPPKSGQNTDPYVFGEHFHYSNCRQEPRLRNLANNSIILFGTEYYNGVNKNNPHFALDTVFIIGKSINASKYNKKNYSNLFHRVTIEKLKDYKNSSYCLYSGKMYHDIKDSNNEIFSFFPCKLSNSSPFERVRIYGNDLNYLNLVVGNGQTASIRKQNINVQDEWQRIVNIVLKQEFCLGIFAEEPHE